MRIGVNCLHIIPGQLGGLETYMFNLLDDLAATTSDHEFVVFCAAEYRETFAKYENTFDVVPLDVDVNWTPGRIFFEQFVLPKHLRRLKIDLLHSSGYTAPITKCCRSVMTVHDLNYVDIPKMTKSHGRLRWLAIRCLGPLAMRRCNRILTVSHHVRNRVIDFLHLDPEKVRTIYNRPPRDISKIAESRVALPSPFDDGYLLYVASWFPHKNHKVLLTAMANARQKGIALPPLVLAGLHVRSEDGRAKIRDTLRSYGVEDQVHLVDTHLSLSELAYLYKQAAVFVFPSLFEGFGIPVLEAMSANVPVVCSRIEPLVEIADDHALMFAPTDADELLAQLYRVLGDSRLRQELTRKGRQRFLEMTESAARNGAEVERIYSDVLLDA